MWGRVLRGGRKWGGRMLLGGVAGSSLYFGYKNDFDLSSIGAMRLARAGVAAVGIIVDYKLSFSKLDETESEEDSYKEILSGVHLRSARRLLKLASDNGGVWIKVGQHLGALDYLLPVEYTSTLCVLHSSAPESSFTDICAVIKQELKKDVGDIFVDIEDRPLGTASLAQVYKATLKDGRIAAVKVQHPKVKAHSRVDMATMEVLVRIAAKLFPEFKLLWLVDQTKRNLPRELDFLCEAAHADRVRRMFHHLSFLKVPEIYWDYSTDRVLTMEYCEGGQINDLDYILQHKLSPDEVSRKIGHLYSEMIFVQGYVHCDPHPGNVLVHKEPHEELKIVLLDHGLYTTLADDFRLNYAKLWLSILHADLDGIKAHSQAMGVGDLYGLFACMLTARSWKAVTGGIGKQPPSKNEEEEIKRYVASLLSQISDVLDRVPQPMVLIFKTNDLLRSIEQKLKTEKTRSSFLEMTRCCVSAVYDYEWKHAHSWTSKLNWKLLFWWEVLKLYIYDRYLFGLARFHSLLQLAHIES